MSRCQELSRRRRPQQWLSLSLSRVKAKAMVGVAPRSTKMVVGVPARSTTLKDKRAIKELGTELPKVRK